MDFKCQQDILFFVLIHIIPHSVEYFNSTEQNFNALIKIMAETLIQPLMSNGALTRRTCMAKIQARRPLAARLYLRFKI